MGSVATAKLSSKGQVVIPEEIRLRLGLKAGAEFVVVGEAEKGRSAGVGEEAHGGFIVIVVIAIGFRLEGTVVAKAGVEVFQERPAALEFGLFVGIVDGVGRQAGLGLDMKGGVESGEETGLEEAGLCLRYIERDVGGERIGGAAALLPLHGNNGADAGDFFMQGRIQGVRGLHIILRATVDAVPGFERPDDSGVGQLLGKLGEQPHGPFQAGLNFADIKIGRGPGAFLEIPGVQMGGTAIEHDPYDKTCGAAGLYRLGGAGLSAG